MAVVRIGQAEPWPGRLGEGGFAISEFLVVLADDAGGRALPVWLTGPDGDSLWRLRCRPAGDRVMAGVAEELTGRILGAAGVNVTGVDIDELATDVTKLPSRSDPGPPWRPPSAARIGLRGPAGTRQVMTRLGCGLALAVAAAAPVRVSDMVMDTLAVPVRDDDLLEQFSPVDTAPGRLGRGRRWRFEPRNLAFAYGLDGWEFGGRFLWEAGGPHWPDYSCAAKDQRAPAASRSSDGRATCSRSAAGACWSPPASTATGDPSELHELTVVTLSPDEFQFAVRRQSRRPEDREWRHSLGHGSGGLMPASRHPSPPEDRCASPATTKTP